ncbi:hypothetical protein BGZ96_005243, partial [Linnemannia gamsii]
MKIMHGITLCFLAMTAVVQAAHPQVPVPDTTSTATSTVTGGAHAAESGPTVER